MALNTSQSINLSKPICQDFTFWKANNHKEINVTDFHLIIIDHFSLLTNSSNRKPMVKRKLPKMLFDAVDILLIAKKTKKNELLSFDVFTCPVCEEFHRNDK